MADMARRLAPACVRSQSRPRALAYLQGLLREAERKHRWHVADVCGETTPSGVQDVRSRADGDANASRAELRTDLIPHLGASPGGLVLEETGFRKQGRHAAGVARPDTGTVGTVEPCHMGVVVGYAGRLGHALVDRDLSGPAAWATNRARCREAGIPADRPLATTPQRARQLRARTFAAGLPAPGVTGDRVSGADRRLRRWLEARPQASVLAVLGTEEVWLGPPPRPGKPRRASRPAQGWTRRSAGDGATGPRWADGRWLPLATPRLPGWRRGLRVRRRLSAPPDLTASVVFAPQATPLEAVVRVAGRRWTIARGVEAATGAGGLEHDAVRRWTGWYRHSTRARWALALLTSLRAGTRALAA
jgi:SRSO17 transposase